MSDEGHGNRHWYLISYDIRDPRRWREVYKTLLGHGERVQYSLFRCRLSRTEIEALRWELEKILGQEDDLLVIHLCPTCASGVEIRGQGDGWEPPPRFTIL